VSGNWGRGRAARLFMVVVGLLGLAVVGASPSQAHDGSGSISGRVTDTDGNPIPYVCVYAERNTQLHGGMTDHDGRYTVSDVPAGVYRVTFGCWGGEWVRETYDDYAELYGAGTPVELGVGEAVAGIDAALVRGASVSGRMVDDTGAPVASGWVSAWEPGTFGGDGQSTGPDGAFRFSGMRPGVYKVGSFQSNPEIAYPPGPDGMVLAAGQSLDGIVLTVRSKGDVSGQVVDPGGLPVADACVDVIEPDGPIGGVSAWATTDAAGNYTTSKVPAGAYTVRVSDCNRQPARFATSYYGGTDRSSAQLFEVAGHQTATGIDVTTRAGGVVSGTITDLSGQPVAGACVSASVTDYDHGYGATTTDAAGAYRIPALRPGDYTVHVDPCGDEERFLRQSYGGEPGPLSQGTPIPVSEGSETAGIDVAVSPPAAIEGTVRDAFGAPVESACAIASDPDYPEMSLGIVHSDATGHYRLPGLPPGDAIVSFSDCSHPREFNLEYWQDAATPAEATPIALGLGQTVTGIDPVLGRIDPGSISGVVRQGADPVANACVSASGANGSGANTSTELDGSYTLVGLDPGDYIVGVRECFPDARFDPQWWQATLDPAEADPVTVGAGEATTGIDFDVFAVRTPPRVTGITPSSGSAAGGTVVSLVGRGLKDVTEVRFGDQAVSVAKVLSNNQIDVVAPAGPVGETVAVTAVGPGGTSSPVTLTRYTFTPKPSVASVTPDRGPTAGGDEVRIAGTLLTGATAVRFGSVDAPAFTVESDSSIVATVPAAAQAGEVDVVVVTPGGVSDLGVKYQYVDPLPVVSAVSPSAGPLAGGTVVSITGTRLSDAFSVEFGGQPSWYFSVVDDTRIDAYVPEATAPGAVAVRVATPLGLSEESAAAQYEYVAAPTLTGLSPDKGPETGGDTVTLTGTGFDRATEVLFQYVQVPFTVVSPTTITAEVPPGAGGNSVIVRSVGGESNPQWYTYVPPPTIWMASPDTGALSGGTTTLHGVGLAFVEEVTVDGVVVPATANPDGTVTVTMPAHDRGSVSIGVTSIGGSTVLPNAYRYVGAPQVTAVSPPAGSILGGEVVLSGLDLVGVQSVAMEESGLLVGPQATPLAYRAGPDETVVVTLPPHLPGTVYLRVTTAWGTSDAGEGRYEYTVGLPQ